LYVSVSISQVIGCEDRLRNYLDCVWLIDKLYSHSKTNLTVLHSERLKCNDKHTIVYQK